MRFWVEIEFVLNGRLHEMLLFLVRLKIKKVELKTQNTSQFKPFKSKTQKQIHFCGQP
jgi:hypothetical protein